MNVFTATLINSMCPCWNGVCMSYWLYY